MANVLATLFTDIANSIRSKTGGTDKMSPSDFPSQIDSIQGGGGGVPTGYKTVTFMNGDNVIFERLVLSGDDCPDPVTQGRIETPTKESTAQYNYTHSGWASVNGGTADSNILKSIATNKVVYSVFTKSVRTYTITFYDEDGTTVLHTQQDAYGTVPTYTPTKDGFVFDKWSPTPVKVTGDTSYTASWKSVLASGTCGDTVMWDLSTNYTLTISGTGDMANYYGYLYTPWASYVGQIVGVTVSNGVTSIGNYAFQNCTNLTSVDIPNGVTSIGGSAFCDCTNLTSVTIPDSVTSIGKEAFGGCGNLTSINVDNNNTYYSSLDGVLFNATKSEILQYPIGKTQTTYTIPNGVTSIGGNAFRKCTNLTSVTIPESVTSIGGWAFSGGNLKEAIFVDPEGWTAGDTALSSSDLANSITAASYLKSKYFLKNWTKS